VILQDEPSQDRASESEQRIIPAAAYVRMSTDHQRYSTANQSDAIARYADTRGYRIVRLYADEGKSGLKLDGRAALRSLISDVENGDCDFEAVLVYDVSRWGRFQDTDESAFYEHICKRAGVRIRYCAEPFENDGSPVSAIVKNVKRLMAGEYSRELSAKVFAGQQRLVKLGYRQGGPPGYGLRRLLVDAAGTPKLLLSRGQIKNIVTDRIVLVPGPECEVSTVKWIFRSFVNGISERQIASTLNSRKCLTHLGRPWSRNGIVDILTNEKYIGRNVWNRASSKLKSKRVANNREIWVRSDNAFTPIVDVDLFEAAQRIFALRKQRRTDEYLLEHLNTVLRERGYLSAKTISESDGPISGLGYKQRFGGLLEAYKRVGHAPERDYRFLDFTKHRRRARLDTFNQIATAAEDLGAVVEKDPLRYRLTINGELTWMITASRCFNSDAGAHRWNIVFDNRFDWDLLVAVRMNHRNDGVLDYYVLPRAAKWPNQVRIREENDFSLECYRMRQLDEICGLIQRSTLTEFSHERFS
jgi:DNA invertase Pin-like site-specific DNA recombinase